MDAAVVLVNAEAVHSLGHCFSSCQVEVEHVCVGVPHWVDLHKVLDEAPNSLSDSPHRGLCKFLSCW